MAGDEWPAEAGTYALLLAAAGPLVVPVGRLGPCHLPAGFLVYLGSARGPGGLRSRLARHLRPDKAPRWHVDYLSVCLPLVHVVARITGANLECAWTRRLLALPGALAPIAGFGSSDCAQGCPAHLVWLPDDLSLAALDDCLRSDERVR